MKRRTYILIAIALFAALFLTLVSKIGQNATAASDTSSADQWEYLVVTGASRVNLSPSENSTLRKEPAGGFTREAFVLEQNLDKLGAKGWELVTVSGSSAEPIYYFKRRK